MDKILLLNKDEGISSAGALNGLKKKFQIRSLGHAGTLDPFATGLLIVASGRATKVLPYFQDLTKEYIARVQLGVQTDTDDKTGEITERSAEKISLTKALPEILPQFEGWITQTPPAFSAIKIGGERAYKLARANIPVEMPSRQVQIHSLKVLEVSEETQSFLLQVVCSKGTYIRSLARDMGKALGSFGTLWELERSAIGPYRISEAHRASEVQVSDFRSVQDMFHHYPAVTVKPPYLKIVSNGAKIQPSYLLLKEGIEGYTPSYYRLYSENSDFLGIVENASSHFLYKEL